MVGLVLVSHSAALASGAAELAAQMAAADLRIGIAGGLDQPGRPLGTDAALVLRAIDEAWSEDGVLVLMDLGSAVLSAEMALELLPEERRDRVLLTEAPFVEGAVAAAVAASLGEPLDRVAAEAAGGLTAKAAHLAPDPARTTDARAVAGTLIRAGGEPAAEERELRVTVHNRFGLHARPAAALVRTAAAYDAVVTITDATSARGPASARSLNAVATLGVADGDEILLRAAGPQADEALAAIRRLADEGFGEPKGDAEETGAKTAPAVIGDAAEATGDAAEAAGGDAAEAAGGAALRAPVPGTVLHGLPASSGIVVGRARHLRQTPVELPIAEPGDPAAGLADPASDPVGEWATLQRALAAAATDARHARDSVAERASEYDAAIFEAHLLFLEDETLLDPARERILDGGESAAQAWVDSVATAAAAWDALDDPYQRARAADLRSIGEQVLRHLQGAQTGGGQPDAAQNGAQTGAPPVAEGIVIAQDLSPAETAALDPKTVLGIACAFGGPTAHSAILARSLGIPAVVGLGSDLLGVREGTTLALDGDVGTLTVDPPPDVVEAAEVRRISQAARDDEAQRFAHEPAVTHDGVIMQVTANTGGPRDAPAAVAAGADGVGLLRSEFLFLEADHLPTEDEQERAYREAAEALAGRPLTVRTLDAGADKPLAYLPIAPERNPFLGVRGLRLGLERPDVLKTQLRAILRVAADHPVRVMFPMVAMLDELRRAKELLAEAQMALDSAGISTPAHIDVGIMVEVPAAALLAEAFAPEVDFFSIGTNDLTQYTLAAERGNAGVAALADALHPAVLRLVEHTARAAARSDRPVAVCGEVAGDPLAIPLLLGLGVSELSMAPVRIPLAKQAVRSVDLQAAKQLAREALTAESAAEVRRLCGAFRQE